MDASAKQFSNAAKTYNQASFLEQEVGSRLLERLNSINFSPKTILDLGCGTGQFISQLQNKFAEACIIGVDFAEGMLNFAKQYATCLQADVRQLPIANQSIDLIFCNCCIPHLQSSESIFKEISRVLRTNGLFIFTTYGPDTLAELGFQGHWPDMHVYGDLLLKLGFIDPVVDNEILVLNYATTSDLYLDLQETGAFLINNEATTDLSRPIDITYEIIYGYAWGKKLGCSTQDNSDTFYIQVTR